jgi:hypothetical protein
MIIWNTYFQLLNEAGVAVDVAAPVKTKAGRGKKTIE